MQQIGPFACIRNHTFIKLYKLCTLISLMMVSHKAIATMDSGYQSCLNNAVTTCTNSYNLGTYTITVDSTSNAPPTIVAYLYCQQHRPGPPTPPTLTASCPGTTNTPAPKPPMAPGGPPKCAVGSIIHADNLSVGEAVSIAGTPFSLVYFSDRVRGRKLDYEIDIPVVGATVDSSLTSVVLTIGYGNGRTYTQTFPPTANTTYHFSWDGKDASGNTIASTAASISLQEYHSTTQTYGGALVYNVNLGNWQAVQLGLGGWNISSNHYYDSFRPRVFLGDGNVRNITADNYTGSKYSLASEDGSELYIFDSSGKHLSTLDGLTGVTKLSFNYDSYGRLATIVDAYGSTTSILRDGSGNLLGVQAPHGQITNLTLDSNGNLATIVTPNSETYSMTYVDANGLLSSFQKPAGQITNFSYDTTGTLAQDNTGGAFLNFLNTGRVVDRTIKMTSTLGRITTSEVIGSLTSPSFNRIDTYPDSKHTTFSYSPGTQIYFTDKDLSNRKTNYASDRRFRSMAPYVSGSSLTANGLTVSNTSSTPSDAPLIGSPTTPYTSTNYFGFTYLQNSVSFNSKTATSYFGKSSNLKTDTSYAGKVTKTTIDSLARLASFQLANFQPFTFSYDTEGRLNQVTQLSRMTTINYDSSGNIYSISDPNSLTTTFTYNLNGKMTSRTLPDLRTTYYTYDSNGNLASIMPPNGLSHTFSYNTLDLNSSYSAPPLGSAVTTNYIYNLDRQLTQIQMPSGDNINFDYPTSGVLDFISTPLGSVTYGFYNSDTARPVAMTTFDGLSYSADYQGVYFLDFHQTGNIKGNMAFTYDSLGRLSTSQVTGVTGSNSITLAYNDDSLLKTSGAETLTRDTLSSFITGISLLNFSDTLTYDSNYGELSGSNINYLTSTLFSEGFTRSLGSQITAKSENVNGVANSYSYYYDNAGRLTQVNNGASVQSVYTYDANSNRLTSTLGTNPTVNATYNNDDQLMTYGNNSYTYNANGFLATKSISSSLVATYTYDLFGNLRRVVIPAISPNPAKQVDYLIDGLNRRVGKKIGGAVTQMFVYQSQTQIAAQLDATGALVSRFVYASKSNVPDYMVQGTTTYKIISDHLGSPRLVVNASTGVIAQQINYDEFGNVLSDTNPGFQPFGFAGGLYDSDTKLLRFGVRDYDPEVGRWTSKDPLLFGGGQTNLYGYTFNDPINFIDPNGTAPFSFLSPNQQANAGAIMSIIGAAGIVAGIGTQNIIVLGAGGALGYLGGSAIIEAKGRGGSVTIPQINSIMNGPNGSSGSSSSSGANGSASSNPMCTGM